MAEKNSFPTRKLRTSRRVAGNAIPGGARVLSVSRGDNTAVIEEEVDVPDLSAFKKEVASRPPSRVSSYRPSASKSQSRDNRTTQPRAAISTPRPGASLVNLRTVGASLVRSPSTRRVAPGDALRHSPAPGRPLAAPIGRYSRASQASVSVGRGPR